MENFTVCSNAHCYKSAAITNDLSRPPFCKECQDKVKKQTQEAKA